MGKNGWVCVILLLLSACSMKSTETATPKPTITPTPDAIREEERVYKALIEATYPSDVLVIMEQTQTDVLDLASDETYQHVEESLQHLLADTLTNFKTRNDSSYPLKTSMILGRRYTLFSEKDKQDLFQINQSGWDVFYNRYPEAPGIITLSRVGFNEQNDQALVYLGIQSYWLAGSGNFYLLNKIDGEWVIDQQVMTWVS
jgi:hypothetical protein